MHRDTETGAWMEKLGDSKLYTSLDGAGVGGRIYPLTEHLPRARHFKK